MRAGAAECAVVVADMGVEGAHTLEAEAVVVEVTPWRRHEVEAGAEESAGQPVFHGHNLSPGPNHAREEEVEAHVRVPSAPISTAPVGARRNCLPQAHGPISIKAAIALRSTNPHSVHLSRHGRIFRRTGRGVAVQTMVSSICGPIHSRGVLPSIGPAVVAQGPNSRIFPAVEVTTVP